VNSLKYRPWRSLVFAALLSSLVVKMTDLILGQILNHFIGAELWMKFLLTKPGFTLLSVCSGLAIGSLGVVFLEQFENDRMFYSSTLWILVGCILISLWLILRLDIGGLSLVKIHYISTVGIIVGVFWKGRYLRR
jgi:hypothetical protein